MKTTVTLAAGCFWGTQAYFDLQKGVLHTVVGYANGNLPTVTYKQVCSGNTGFVEACQVTFDSNKISLEQIITKFWKVVNPTLLNRQGDDIGLQYRTGIYYDETYTPEMIEVLNQAKITIGLQYNKPIMTEVLPLKNFVIAEAQHQKYLEKNPNGYCHINLYA